MANMQNKSKLQQELEEKVRTAFKKLKPEHTYGWEVVTFKDFKKLTPKLNGDEFWNCEGDPCFKPIDYIRLSDKGTGDQIFFLDHIYRRRIAAPAAEAAPDRRSERAESRCPKCGTVKFTDEACHHCQMPKYESASLLVSECPGSHTEYRANFHFCGAFRHASKKRGWDTTSLPHDFTVGELCDWLAALPTVKGERVCGEWITEITDSEVSDLDSYEVFDIQLKNGKTSRWTGRCIRNNWRDLAAFLRPYQNPNPPQAPPCCDEWAKELQCNPRVVGNDKIRFCCYCGAKKGVAQ